jgi:hypothetical protein
MDYYPIKYPIPEQVYFCDPSANYFELFLVENLAHFIKLMEVYQTQKEKE